MERDDPVWKLLEHASETKPGPMFARDVVRRVRLEESTGRPSWRNRLRSLLSPRVALGGAALAGAAALAFALLPEPSSPPPAAKTATMAPLRAEAFDPVSEMKEVEYFGQLMAVTDPGELDDEALADLMF